MAGRARMVPSYGEVPTSLPVGEVCFVGEQLYVGDASGVPVAVSGGGGGEVSSADITDASVVGRGVLTAVDAAAARSVLEVPEGGLPASGGSGRFLFSDGNGDWVTRPFFPGSVSNALQGEIVREEHGLYRAYEGDASPLSRNMSQMVATRFNPRGVWSSTSSYRAGDAAQYGGKLWWAADFAGGTEPGSVRGSTLNQADTYSVPSSNRYALSGGSWYAVELMVNAPPHLSLIDRLGFSDPHGWVSTGFEGRLIDIDVWYDRAAGTSVLDLPVLSAVTFHSDYEVNLTTPVEFSSAVFLVNQPMQVRETPAREWDYPPAVVISDVTAPPEFNGSAGPFRYVNFTAHAYNRPWRVVFDSAL